MNNTSLTIIQPEELDTIQRAARLLAVSTYFDGKGDNPQAIAMLATKIMAGRELGFGPFASANNIHVIKGKPTIGANLMASAVKSSGRYDYRVKELTTDKCIIEFFEREGDKKLSVGVSEFTMKDALAMELTEKDNWKKSPRNMLFARAMSNGVRWFCPDTFSGNAVYVPEELGAEVDGDGNVIDTTYTVSKPTDVDFSQGKQPAQNPPTTIKGNGTPSNPFDDSNAPDDAEANGTDNGPSDEELAILGKWHNQREAQQWAVEVGACTNMHHAGESWMKIVKANKGFTHKNAGAVYLGFLRRQNEKLEQVQPEAQAA